MENILLWRNDPPTEAQKRAVKNMCHGWKIERSRGLKTKGDYHDEIQRLQAIIDKKVDNRYQEYGFGMSAQDEWAYEVGIEQHF